MGRKAFLMVVALLLGLGSPAAAGPAPRDSFTRDQMRKVLLGPGDMPAGWTLAEQGDDAWGDVFVPSAPCDGVPREPGYKPLPVSVYVSFDQGGPDRNVLEAVGAGGRTLSQEMITSLGDVVDDCPVRSGSGRTVTASRLPDPAAAGTSIAVLFTIENRAGTVVSTEQLVVGIIAYGDVCAVVQHSEPDQISLGAARTVLTRAAKKLQRIR